MVFEAEVVDDRATREKEPESLYDGGTSLLT